MKIERDPNPRYVAGLDIGRMRDPTVLVVIDATSGSIVQIEKRWGIPMRDIFHMVVEQFERWNMAVCRVERNSAGDPLLEDLENMGYPVRGHTLTRANKQALLDALNHAWLTRKLRFAPGLSAPPLHEVEDPATQIALALAWDATQRSILVDFI